MQAVRVFGLLLLLLAVQTRAADQATLKTGMQTLPGALPNIGAKDPAIDWDFDLAQEKFYISVPRNYAENQSFGVLVFISPSDESAAVPPGWANVLEERKLIFVAPQNTGNKQPVSRRAGLAVLAAGKMLEAARIDTNRIYVAGLSGGARVALYVAFLRPTLFSGVFAVCGVGFPRKVTRVTATNKDEYGYFSLGKQRADEAKKRVRFVLVTGSKDFRYGNILDIYTGGFQKDAYDVKLIDVPGMEHTICSSQALSDGIVFLDEKREGAPGKR